MQRFFFTILDKTTIRIRDVESVRTTGRGEVFRFLRGGKLVPTWENKREEKENKSVKVGQA